jgi:hypothetical protein
LLDKTPYTCPTHKPIPYDDEDDTADDKSQPKASGHLEKSAEID